MIQSIFRSTPHIVNFINNTSTIRQIHIPKKSQNDITNAFLKIKKNPYQNRDFNDLQKLSTKIVSTNLPPAITQKIRELNQSEVGFLEITGTPYDPILTDTPKEINQIPFIKKTFIPELFCLGVSGIMQKEIFNFRQEGWGTGSLIFNVYPQPNMVKLKGAGGTNNDFGFHMENAWHSQAPDFLILKGLRQDHDKVAITYAVSNRTLYNTLSVKEIDILKNHTFRIMPPEIHRKMEKEKNIIFSEDLDYVGPILVEEQNGIKLVVNFNGMTPERNLTEEHDALKKIEALAKQHSVCVKLRKDNMLIINNNRALHTRNGYTPRFDGKDRWFQRYYLAESTKLWRNLRVLNSDFDFLSSKLADELIECLINQGFLNGQILTSKFNPHDPLFELKLPPSLEEKRFEIIKILLKKGPAIPNRII